MPHTYTKILVHCVFSTKNRTQLIPPDKQPDLWAYMGGIARKNGAKALAVGGTANHAHMLLSIPPTIPVAKAVQLIKAGSSKWIRDYGGRLFAWQEAYGAFSVGASQVPATIAYINNQAKHHSRRGFEEEFVLFLKKNGIAFDEKFLFG
jgi:REP element-mobilizing transposase RayT